MKVSRHWLSKYFDQPLPEASVLADALTFHAFEIEEVKKVGEDEVLDIKVTANRGADCLSHRGIAKELAAILSIPLMHDPLKEAPRLKPVTTSVSVTIEDPSLSPRYIAGVIKGVKVGPSPEWLKRNLEAIGQKSINNIVDATNFMMFNLGQPLHAFDVAKITEARGTRAIVVRRARAGEKLAALDGKTYELKDSMLVIADGNADVPVGIAGVKGGMPASITESTTDIILESANFNGISVRKTAAALHLRTDASARFEQGISPELAAYGMHSVAELIVSLAGGTLEGFADVYPAPRTQEVVSVSLNSIVQVLGVPLQADKVASVFDRLQFTYEQKKSDVFIVTPPFERTDITSAEDLIEEVARVNGYDTIPPQDLPPFSKPQEINKNFYYAEAAREFFVSHGFSEILTSVFADKGERAVLNKVESDRPYLRTNLTAGMEAALEKNKRNAEALAQSDVRLFEIGTVFGKQDERVHLAVGAAGSKKSPKPDALLAQFIADLGAKMPEDVGKGNVVEINFEELVQTLPHPGAYEKAQLTATKRYQSFSKYPFILRDVAFWLPEGTDWYAADKIIKEVAGPLLRQVLLTDSFEKEKKISSTLRLIFQSFDRTLEEKEVHEVIEKVSAALKAKGYEIR